MMSVVLGLLAVLAAGAAWVRYLNEFVVVAKGLLPFLFICGGLVAVIAGISSLKKK